MRINYHIGINQIGATISGMARDGNRQITDVVDWAILAIIAHNVNRHDIEKISENGITYVLFNYKQIIDENPLLPFSSKSALSRRIDKLFDLELIDRMSASNRQYFVCLTPLATGSFLYHAKNDVTKGGYFDQLKPLKKTNRPRSSVAQTQHPDASVDQTEHATPETVAQTQHPTQMYSIDKNKDSIGGSEKNSQPQETGARDISKIVSNWENLNEYERAIETYWHSGDIEKMIPVFRNAKPQVDVQAVIDNAKGWLYANQRSNKKKDFRRFLYNFIQKAKPSEYITNKVAGGITPHDLMEKAVKCWRGEGTKGKIYSAIEKRLNGQLDKFFGFYTEKDARTGQVERWQTYEFFDIDTRITNWMNNNKKTG